MNFRWNLVVDTISHYSRSIKYVMVNKSMSFILNTASTVANISMKDWLTYYFPILTVIMLLWPTIVWLFWILTSLIFGILQLIYVAYQFLIVSVDIYCLSLLKTYAMMRSWIRYYYNLIGLTTTKNQKGWRRQWLNCLKKAKNFSDYGKIEVKEPTEDDMVIPLLDSESEKESAMSSILKWFKISNDNKVSGENNNIDLKHEKKSKKKKISHSFSCTDFNKTRRDIIKSKSQNNLLKLSKSILELSQSQLGRTGTMLTATTRRLHEARLQAIDVSRAEESSSLEFLMSAVVKRNHLNVDDLLIDDARSVADGGQHRLSPESRNTIHDFMSEVESCLNYLCHSAKNNSVEAFERIRLFQKLKQNNGCTALMLSGGGAQAMYHLGTIRALIESSLYDEISVISGTSGGSICAGMCAIMTSDELLKHICIPTVSTDYRFTGEMAKRNIRWFPKVWDMGMYWLKHHYLVDSKEFKKCCDYYYGDITFEEAYQKTKKNVCISVSACRRSGRNGVQRLLLNHVSTPHVTISSAVQASCSLPGVMRPTKLEMKHKNGNKEPFDVDSDEWIDGSIQADLPFKRISTLFNATNYIVCQVNFHIVPLLNKAHHPNTTSLYWRLFQILEWDIRSRVLNLSKLGLFPTFFGQDVTNVFKQKYHGNLTIVPRFTPMQVFGLKVLVNPTHQDMNIYLKNGQAALWPYVRVINHMLRFERAIDKGIKVLKQKTSNVYLQEKLKHIQTTPKNNLLVTKDLQNQVKTLQDEVASLKQKLRTLEHKFDANNTTLLNTQNLSSDIHYQQGNLKEEEIQKWTQVINRRRRNTTA